MGDEIQRNSSLDNRLSLVENDLTSVKAAVDETKQELREISLKVDELLTILKHIKLILELFFRVGDGLRWVASIAAPVLAAWYIWRNNKGGG